MALSHHTEYTISVIYLSMLSLQLRLGRSPVANTMRGFGLPFHANLPLQSNGQGILTSTLPVLSIAIVLSI